VNITIYYVRQVYVTATSHDGDDRNPHRSLRCGRRLYDVTALENRPIAETIVKVGVPGSDVTFALDDTDDAVVHGLVRVDARTGSVSTRRPLDRERIDAVSFGVVATETGSGSRTSGHVTGTGSRSVV